MQFGIQTWSLRNSMTTLEGFENTMRRVVEMGYTNVQTRAPEFMNDQELAVMLSGFGLQADSAFCSVYDIPEKVAEIIAGADALKTDVLRVI